MEKYPEHLTPAAFAEKEIIKSILENKYQISEKLLPERELATHLGVTRLTLREALQRLSCEGWITIKQGRSTIVNDYREKRGFGILGKLDQFNDALTQKMMKDWLEFRIMILPPLARNAIENHADKIKELLETMPSLSSSAEEFAQFNLSLQLLFVRLNDNVIAQMIYNDLQNTYLFQARRYFSDDKNRYDAIDFYKKLRICIDHGPEKSEGIVRRVMKKNLCNWLAQTE